MERLDYYSFLGVSREATAEQIRAAYRRLAMRLHPDKNPAAGEEWRFAYLCEAYRCLSDPDARAAYNRQLARGDPQWAAWVNEEDGEDEGAATEEPEAQAAGEPGSSVRTSGMADPSPTCGSTRYVSVKVPRWVPGRRLVIRFVRRDPCRRCQGTGQLRGPRGEAGDHCPACWGVGCVSADRCVTIAFRGRRVLGGQLVLPGEGDAGARRGPRGDLVLYLWTPDHTIQGLILPAVITSIFVYLVFGTMLLAASGC